MSVIIDIEMPKRCLDCQLMGREKMYCQLHPRKDLNVIRVVSGKPEWCPIKSADDIAILLDGAHDDGFKQGYLQAESDCKVQIDEMIAEIEAYNSPLIGKNVVLDIIHKYCDLKENKDG